MVKKIGSDQLVGLARPGTGSQASLVISLKPFVLKTGEELVRIEQNRRIGVNQTSYTS